jgi:hypothetical protein
MSRTLRFVARWIGERQARGLPSVIERWTTPMMGVELADVTADPRGVPWQGSSKAPSYDRVDDLGGHFDR